MALSRSSGILLHVSSLPGPFGIGDLGPGAYRFADFLAHTGQQLWQYQTGSGIISQPTTFRGPDGKQYVAIVSGVGGWAGAIVAGGLDPRDSTAALGFAAAMADLPQYSTKGGTVHVFSLP